MTRDALGLVSALGYRRTAMLVGHDLGSPVAAYCVLARPDVFPSVMLMSAPFPGPPEFPFNIAESEASSVQPNTEAFDTACKELHCAGRPEMVRELIAKKLLHLQARGSLTRRAYGSRR